MRSKRQSAFRTRYCNPAAFPASSPPTFASRRTMSLIRSLVCILFITTSAIAADKPFLSPALGSHMVLQRDKPNTFWGWTTPGAAVTVTLNDQKADATAGPDGKWIATLTPPPAGGPYTVSINGPQHVELTDLLVGDVWLCGGQSNMEFGITMEKDGAAEVAQSDDNQLRLFLV